MGLRMWTVMRLHLFCLVSQKPSLLSSLLLLNSSLRSRRTDTQAVLCACLPLEIESSSFKVSGSAAGVESLAGASIRVVVLWDWLLWWWSRETKILAALPWLRRASACCGRILVAGR